MVGGQAIDLQAAGQAPGHALTLDADGLRAMHARKTGALIRASAVSGAVMAGADDGAVAAIDRYARPSSASRFRSSTTSSTSKATPAELGKTAGKDAAGGKPTYPALYGLERSRALAAECVERAHAALAGARPHGQAGSARSPTGSLARRTDARIIVDTNEHSGLRVIVLDQLPKQSRASTWRSSSAASRRRASARAR